MEICNNRLIGFFDIIGFGNKLKSYNLEELYTIYLDIINETNKKVFQQVFRTPTGEQFTQQNFFHTEILSDSIILVSHPLSIENVNKFILATIQLLELFFVRQFPLRGVITQDDILIDQENKIILAKRLPDLVKSEKQYDWSGCVILQECHKTILPNVTTTDIIIRNGSEKYFNELNRSSLITSINAGNPCVFYDQTPLKEGLKERALCLNWGYFCQPHDLDYGLQYLHGSKQYNTREFLTYVNSLPLAEIALNDDSLPAVKAKLMLTQSSCRILTLDKNNIPVTPTTLSLTFTEKGNHQITQS